MHTYKRPDRPAIDKFCDVVRFIIVSFLFGILFIIGLGSVLCGDKSD